MRVVFLGTPDFAVPSLVQLHETHHEILAVLTRADRPAGRSRKLVSSAVKRAAALRGLQVLQPERMGPEVAETVRLLGPDALVVVAYGLILPASILRVPSLGCINLHASLLPRYRGAAPVAHAILNGERTTGVTTLLMDDGIDTGPILLQKDAPIEAEETTGEVEARLAHLGASLLAETLKGLAGGRLVPRPQNDDEKTYAPKIRPEMAQISWRHGAASLVKLIRAMNPRPGASTLLGGLQVKVWRGRAGPPALGGDQEFPPGTVIRVERAPIVTCGQGTTLELREVQIEGRRRVSGEEAVRGRWFRRGDRFNETPAASGEGAGPKKALL